MGENESLSFYVIEHSENKIIMQSGLFENEIRPGVLLSSIQQFKGAEGRDEQRRGLRTKALMRDLGTCMLACRHRVVRTGKTLWK